MTAAPASAQSEEVSITKLNDVGFGPISNFSTDLRNNQNICVYTKRKFTSYQVTAYGSGSGGQFLLNSGSYTLPYAVQWNEVSGQTSGTELNANVALTGQFSQASNHGCTSGDPTAGTLITILRSSDIQNATAGNYSGTLTLTIAPN